jgi:hypothetical protein
MSEFKGSKSLWLTAVGAIVFLLVMYMTVGQATAQERTRVKAAETAQTSEPPTEEVKLVYKKTSAQSADESADQSSDEQKTKIAPKTVPQRKTGRFVKIGDIKGESDPETQTPAHTPEWTNDGTGDPGTADKEHKKWIDIESMSSPMTKPSAADRITVAPQGYVCEGGVPNPECTCSGVLDCNKLWSSGKCVKDSEWEDGNDNSKGGCSAN